MFYFMILSIYYCTMTIGLNLMIKESSFISIGIFNIALLFWFFLVYKLPVSEQPMDTFGYSKIELEQYEKDAKEENKTKWNINPILSLIYYLTLMFYALTSHLNQLDNDNNNIYDILSFLT